MEAFDLFPSRVFKIRIPSNLFDKEHIIKTLIENYEKDPSGLRNKWDSESHLHHYYNDWDNEVYNPLSLDKLTDVYQNTLNEFMSTLKTSQPIEWKWVLENITVNAQSMSEHDHLGFDNGYQGIFSCVHFIKFDKSLHNSTTLINPLAFSAYGVLTEGVSSKLNTTEISNSNYFKTWEVDIEEDDFLIFPSYLKHKINSKINNNNFRITSAINIKLKI